MANATVAAPTVLTRITVRDVTRPRTPRPVPDRDPYSIGTRSVWQQAVARRQFTPTNREV